MIGSSADTSAPRFYEAGLICRTDDRGDPIVQLAPPLVAGPEEFDFIERTLRNLLVDMERVNDASKETRGKPRTVSS